MNFDRTVYQDCVAQYLPYNFWLSIEIDYRQKSGTSFTIGIDRMMTPERKNLTR